MARACRMPHDAWHEYARARTPSPLDAACDAPALMRRRRGWTREGAEGCVANGSDTWQRRGKARRHGAWRRKRGAVVDERDVRWAWRGGGGELGGGTSAVEIEKLVDKTGG